MFKFNYIKWFVETQNILPKDNLSNFKLPQELCFLQQKIAEEIKTAGNTTLILSPNISLSIIKDIQYYFQRKLISKDDLEILKKDLIQLVNCVENIAQTGKIKGGNAQIDIYVSMTYLNSSTVYVEYEDITEVHYWIYPNSPIIIKNPNVGEIQKKWFLSLKKSSTLITQSNEILQADFFDMQRKIINKLMDENAGNAFW